MIKQNLARNDQNMCRSSILIAHPGTQYARYLAMELNRRDMLFTFHTGLHIRRYSAFGRLLFSLPAFAHPASLQTRIVELPSAKLRNHPIGEIRQWLTGYLTGGSNEEILHQRNVAFQQSIPDAHLKQSTAVIGYDTSSWLLARQTRSMNCKFILDQSIGHPAEKERTFRFLRDRFPEWSVAVPRKSELHVAEETDEHELADLIVVPSSFVRQTLIAQGVPPSKIRIIPFGTDLTFFYPRDAQRTAGSFVFLFVGSISARKGIPVLLESWSKLMPRNAELWLVGPGEIPQSETGNLPASIRVLGRKGRAEVSELMRRADVFVFPSFFEGLAQVLVEALASGLPLISTPEAGAEDLIRNGKNGFLVPAGDANALSERMHQLLTDHDLLGEMRENVYAERAQLNWSIYGDRWAQVLDELS